MQVKTPDIKEPLEEKLFEVAIIQQEDIFGMLFEKQEIKQNLTGRNIDKSLFDKCYFGRTRSRYINYTDVIFKKCDFSNAVFDDCSFYRVRFEECKMVGTVFTKALFKEVMFLGGNMEYAGAYECRMENVCIQECNLKATMLHDCRQKNLVLEKNRLSQTEVVRTFLKGVDLHSNHMESIRFTGGEFNGAKVSREQALVLSSFLGIIID